MWYAIEGKGEDTPIDDAVIVGQGSTRKVALEVARQNFAKFYAQLAKRSGMEVPELNDITLEQYEDFLVQAEKTLLVVEIK